MPPTNRAYRKSKRPPSKSSIKFPDPLCALCNGDGWRLIPFQGRIVSTRCDCVIQKWVASQKVTPRVRSYKMAQAGDVEESA